MCSIIVYLLLYRVLKSCVVVYLTHIVHLECTCRYDSDAQISSDDDEKSSGDESHHSQPKKRKKISSKAPPPKKRKEVIIDIVQAEKKVQLG